MSDASWLSHLGNDIFTQDTAETEELEDETEESRPDEAWIMQQQQETRRLRGVSWSAMREKVRKVLNYIDFLGINLPLFLDALSWGHEDCWDEPFAKQARTILLMSEELPQILERWCRPPKSGPKTARPIGAKEAFEVLSLQIIRTRINKDMEQSSEILWTKSSKLSATELKKTTYKDVISKLKTGMPVLWSILESAAIGLKGLHKDSTKQPDRVSLSSINGSSSSEYLFLGTHG